MRCPRCYTRIPEEETNCVDCGLPKPRRVTTAEHKVVPAEEPAAPVEAAAAAAAALAFDEQERAGRPTPIYAAKISASKATQHQQKASQKAAQQKPTRVRQPRAKMNRLVLLAGVPLLLSVLGAVIYLYVIPALQPEKMEPQTAIMALNRLRRLPSNEQGLNVHERMMQEVDKSRKVGRLKGYQGWTVNPIAGDKSKVLVIFTFDDYNSQHRAEWLADLVTNTYTPQTELAAAIYRREEKQQ
jgi:hypothetical protein